MRYLLLGLLSLLAWPAHAVTYQFTTLSQDGGIDFDVILNLSGEGPFAVDANRFSTLPPVINASPTFQSLEFSYSFGSDGADVVLTPIDLVSTSFDFDLIEMTNGFFRHTGTTAEFFGGSAGGLLDVWNFTFQSDEIFLPPLSLTGRFVEVSEPHALGVMAFGAAMLGLFGRRRKRSVC